jgi:hypothetical protein
MAENLSIQVCNPYLATVVNGYALDIRWCVVKGIPESLSGIKFLQSVS